MTGNVGKIVQRKLEQVLKKHMGYENVCLISDVLSGKAFSMVKFHGI